MMAGHDYASHAAASAWTKRCYFAGRALMDSALRPHDLGSTQWYVLSHLASHGPTPQRDLAHALHIEKPTLSGVVATLVRKGLIAQATDPEDQRQRLLRLTASGEALWGELPDLTFIHAVAFGGLDPATVAIVIDVLRTATERLEGVPRKDPEP